MRLGGDIAAERSRTLTVTLKGAKAAMLGGALAGMLSASLVRRACRR